MDTRVGIIPVPIFVLIALILWYFASIHKIPTEASMMMAVIALLGFTCGEIGKHLPVFRHLGAAAIFATFIPSFLVYQHWLPADLVTAVTGFYKSTGFLYIFIAAIIVGSIWGMDRQMLIKGFFKIALPTALGSILAAAVGTGVGTLLGLGARKTFFFVVIPVMAGGVGEGAIPLSAGYDHILQPQHSVLAQVLPAVMFGSLMAILISSALSFLGKKRPSLTGNGRLEPGEHDEVDAHQQKVEGNMDVGTIAAGGITVLTLYLLGLVFQTWVPSFAAPLWMLLFAVLLKLGHGVSPGVQHGSFVVYRFFAVAVTYPLLFAVGVAITPWKDLIAAFEIRNLITIAATVATMIGTGFFVARWIKMYPIDLAIINSCRCAQGGTGNVAILTACDRMQLMPFAQVATRIGGFFTVLLAVWLMGRMTH